MVLNGLSEIYRAEKLYVQRVFSYDALCRAKQIQKE